MAAKSIRTYCIEHGKEELLEQCQLPENENLDFDRIGYASHRKIWWQCAKGHKWQGIICNRITKDTGCPFCTNKMVLPGYNDLETTNPALALEWNAEKNYPLLPSQVIAGSDRVVWWKCSLNHEWATSIENRTSKKHTCPFCSGKRAWPGYNDLATLFPDLMEEWHPTLNADLDPTRLRPASAKRAWWKCKAGHVWDALIFNRTGKSRSGCPVCAGNVKAGKYAEWIVKAQKREEELKRMAER